MLNADDVQMDYVLSYTKIREIMNFFSNYHVKC